MLSINTNLSSLIAQNSMKQSTNKLNQAIERMTTGYKINHSKDNAANYSIATNMTTKLGALQVAEDNCAMGLDLLATAEGSLNLIQDKLTRLRSLAVTAQNGTYGAQSLEALETEAESIVSEIKREYANAEYNGMKLFDKLTPLLEEPNRVVNQTNFVAGETYYITTSEDLVKLQDLVNSGVSTVDVKFELTNDINMSGVEFRGIGISSSTAFNGSFDGCGHVIKNLTINTNESSIGLFGLIGGPSIIRNLGLQDVDITGYDRVGGLVGGSTTNENQLIANCYVTGRVNGNNQVGLLAGIMQWGSLLIENCYSDGSVIGTTSVGGLVGILANGATMKKVYSTASVVAANTHAGGLVGQAHGSSIYYSYATGNVTAGQYGAGFAGMQRKGSEISNCYSTGNIITENGNGYGNSGFVGMSMEGSLGSNNAYKSSSHTRAYQAGNGGSTLVVDSFTLSEIEAKYTPEYMGFTEENGWVVQGGKPKLAWQVANEVNLNGQNYINLQVGVNSSLNSSIGFNVAFDVSGINSVLTKGLTNDSTINIIDEMINTVDLKATEFGTVQNRLESVLDEIVISRDNLVSSRSTLRDADIAEVSSTYIQQQILQQASATLLATANQSAGIALQLI